MDRLNAIALELKDLQRRRVAQKKRQYYERKNLVQHPALRCCVTKWEKELMLRLFLFNGYDAATSIQWLKKRKGYQKVDVATEVALKLWVEDWFLTKSDEGIEAI